MIEQLQNVALAAPWWVWGLVVAAIWLWSRPLAAKRRKRRGGLVKRLFLALAFWAFAWPFMLGLWLWRKARGTEIPKSRDRPPIPDGVRFSIFQRDNFRCVYCGKGRNDGVKLHLDHYEPWWKVQEHDPANFVTACDRCNMGKSGKIMKQPIGDFVG